MVMKLLTARDNGISKTLNIEIWAKMRDTTSKAILQRLRNDYSEDEAINLPKYKQPAAMKVLRGKAARQYDTDLKSAADRLWLKFITGGMRHA
jgi:hypothetical protein